MVIDNWDPYRVYSKGDKVIFYDKLYVAIKSHSRVIPIPVIETPNGKLNEELVKPIVLNYFDRLQDAYYNINNKTWVML